MIMNHYKCGCWRDQASLQIWGDHLSVSLGCWGFLPRGDSQGFLKLTVSIVILNCGSLVCTLHQTPFGCTLVPAVLWNWNTRALLSHRLGCKRSCLYLYIYIYIYIYMLKTEEYSPDSSRSQSDENCQSHRTSVRICVYIHTGVHTCTHIHTPHIHTYVHNSTDVYTQTHTLAYHIYNTQTYAYTYMSMDTYTCNTYIHAHIHVYTARHIHVSHI